MAEKGGSSVLEWLVLIGVGVGGGYALFKYRDHLLDYLNRLEKEKEELKAELSRFKREREEVEHAI